MANCRLCGIHAQDKKGGFLTRVNEKGVTGIWECRPSCNSELPFEQSLMAAIEGDFDGLTASR